MIKRLKRVCGLAVGIGFGTGLLAAAHGEELANRFDVVLDGSITCLYT